MKPIDGYRQAKEVNRDTILLLKVGGVYETFDADANLVARVCKLTVVMRGGSDGYPATSFPGHRLDECIRSLLLNGHRVAVCEEVV